jgi:hypothetical protein
MAALEPLAVPAKSAQVPFVRCIDSACCLPLVDPGLRIRWGQMTESRGWVSGKPESCLQAWRRTATHCHDKPTLESNRQSTIVTGLDPQNGFGPQEHVPMPLHQGIFGKGRFHFGQALPGGLVALATHVSPDNLVFHQKVAGPCLFHEHKAFTSTHRVAQGGRRAVCGQLACPSIAGPGNGDCDAICSGGLQQIIQGSGLERLDRVLGKGCYENHRDRFGKIQGNFKPRRTWLPDVNFFCSPATISIPHEV